MSLTTIWVVVKWAYAIGLLPAFLLTWRESNKMNNRMFGNRVSFWLILLVTALWPLAMFLEAKRFLGLLRQHKEQ